MLRPVGEGEDGRRSPATADLQKGLAGYVAVTALKLHGNQGVLDYLNSWFCSKAEAPDPAALVDEAASTMPPTASAAEQTLEESHAR
jgi:hypothetical protein